MMSQDTADQPVYNATLTKLCLAADYYSTVNPSLARIYMSEVERLKSTVGLPPTTPHLSCAGCGQIYRPGNHRIHIIPKMKLTKKVQRLLRKNVKAKRLGKYQRALVDRFRDGPNLLKCSCSVCGSCNRLKGVSRLLKATPKPTTDVKLTKSKKKRMRQKKHWKSRDTADSGLCLSSSSLVSSASSPSITGNGNSIVPTTTTNSSSISIHLAATSLAAVSQPLCSSTPTGEVPSRMMLADEVLSTTPIKSSSTTGSRRIRETTAHTLGGSTSTHLSASASSHQSNHILSQSLGGSTVARSSSHQPKRVLPQPRGGSTATVSSSGSAGTGKRRKGPKGAFSRLQGMLAREERHKQDAAKSSSLNSFLSSVSG